MYRSKQLLLLLHCGLQRVRACPTNDASMYVYQRNLLLMAVEKTHGELAELLVADHTSGGWITTTRICCAQPQRQKVSCKKARLVLNSSLMDHWRLTTA